MSCKITLDCITQVLQRLAKFVLQKSSGLADAGVHLIGGPVNEGCTEDIKGTFGTSPKYI